MIRESLSTALSWLPLVAAIAVLVSGIVAASRRVRFARHVVVAALLWLLAMLVGVAADAVAGSALEGHDGIEIIATMAIEALYFAVTGVALAVLAAGVVVRRSPRGTGDRDLIDRAASTGLRWVEQRMREPRR